MEGIRAYTLFAPGGINNIPGEFPGNTVVYVDEATNQVLQVSPIGTPFAGRDVAKAAPEVAQPEQGEALPDKPEQASNSEPDAGKTMGG